MAEAKTGLHLSWRTLLVAIPSFAIYQFNDRLLAWFGEPSSLAPAIPRIVTSHLESGARLEFLAMLILFAGVATAALAAVAAALRAINPVERYRIVTAAVALTAAAWLMIALPETPGIPMDIGLPDKCRGIERAMACGVDRYIDLLNLLDAWKVVLIVATAALILGTICCLAEAPTRATRQVRVAVLKRQAMRLNLFLYLSAMLLVAALLVQLTFLRWPRFAIPPADASSFDAQVSAIILYYGVGYSVFLASYYIPVAFRLGRRAEALADEDLRDEIFRTATTGPASVTKVAVSILAPALAGLLSAWVDLPG